MPTEAPDGPEPDHRLGSPSASPMVRVAIAVAFVAMVVVAIALAAPPSVARDVGPEGFSVDRAMKHLTFVAAAPRPFGSPRGVEVRDYLRRELRALGLDVDIDAAHDEQSFTPGNPAYAGIHNIVAVLRGTAGRTSGRSALLLAAHYDSVAAGPGASDDGVGVVTILETLRALRAGPPLATDVIVLFSDAEERGLVGARELADETPALDHIAVAINFEARGSRGPAIMFETSTDAGALVRTFRSAAPHPFASSLTYEVYRRMPNDTDFTVFKKHGVQGLNFAFIEGLENYHQPTDDIAHLDPRSLQHDGETALALTRAFASQDLDPLPPERDVYFNPIGSELLVYGEDLIVPFEVLAAAALMLAIVMARKRAHVGLRDIAIGAGGFMAGLAGAVMLGLVIRRLGLALTDARGLIEHLAEVGVLTVASTFGAAWALARWLRRHVSTLGLSLGVALVHAAMMPVLSAMAPGASYLFSIPLASISMGALAMASPDAGRLSAPRAGVLVMALAVPVFIGAPLVRQLHIALGFQLPALTALVAFVFIGLASPALLVLMGPRNEPPRASSS